MKLHQRKIIIFTLFFFGALVNANAQNKSFKISANGDTINKIDKKGFKQGKFVLRM